MSTIDNIVWFKNADARFPVRDFYRTLPGADRRLISDVFCNVIEMDRQPALFVISAGNGISEYRIRGSEKNHWVLTVLRNRSLYLIRAGSSMRKQKAPAASVKKVAGLLNSGESDELPGQIWIDREKGPAVRRNDLDYLKFRLGVYFREIRNAAGFTQNRIADLTGVAASVVSEMENHPGHYSVDDLAGYLNKLQSVQY